MPNLQDVIANYQLMNDDDKIHFFHFLNVTKDPVIVEREKTLRDSWKRNLKVTPEISNTPEQVSTVPLPLVPTPTQEDNNMALDPEVKAMFDQMQTMFVQNFQSVANSVSDIQKQIAQQELKTYKEKLISDKKVPAHLVRYVNGNTVEELNNAADAVLQSYAAIEEEMKQRYSTPAAQPATTPTVSEQPAQEQPAATNNPSPAASNTPPLNPLAPPSPDPVLPNPPAGLGAGQQITAEEVSQIDYDRYSSDPQLRAKLEADLKARLGNKPLYTSQN
jgi:hypothetical protein